MLTLALIAIFCIIFFGYPFVLFVLSKFARRTVGKREIFPFVSIVVPCYNERRFVERKIRNTLDSDYPAPRRELIVVDSGSTDGTANVLEEYSTNGLIRSVQQHERHGKPAAINEALEMATGELIILTDADSTLDPTAIRRVVSCFADSSVGAVVGNLKLTAGKTVLSKMNSVFYQLFREGIRELESEIDSVSYFSGELLAFRRTLIDRINPKAISDDLFILFEVRKKGYRCISESQAFVVEEDVETVRGQLAHKRRTAVGSLQVFVKNAKMLFNPRYGWFGALIFPAYVLRVLLAPFLLLAIEISALLSIPHWIQGFSLEYQIALLCLSLFVAGLSVFKTFRSAILGILYGLFVQLAIFAGIFDFVRGNYTVLWPKKWEIDSPIETTKGL